MKTIINYECEICRRRYVNAEQAKECEERGIPKIPPIYIMYGDHQEGSFYKNITFAIAKTYKHDHCFTVSSWACRDNGAGDSLGKEKCGDNSFLCNWDSFKSTKLKYNHPTYKRLYEWMIKNNKKPLIWDGKNILDAPKPSVGGR